MADKELSFGLAQDKLTFDATVTSRETATV
jgi:hypothetical protein